MQVTSARSGPVRVPGVRRRTNIRGRACQSQASQTSDAALELDQAKVRAGMVHTRAPRPLRNLNLTRFCARTLPKELFEAKSHLFVDMRSTKAYEYEHVTKPVKMTVNVPFTQGSMEEFVGELKVRFRPGAKLLLVDETGEDGIQAAEVLREAGYVGVYGVLGGYTGWLKNYTTTGRRRIQGKFVSTGKEALKSGLGLDPAVASTYEENHGKVDLSLPSNRG